MISADDLQSEFERLTDQSTRPRQSIRYDARHWRVRAAQAIAQAEQMRDDEAKQSLLKVAHEYEKLAERADKFVADSQT